MRIHDLLYILILCLCVGCNKTVTQPPPVNPAPESTSRAQPKLPILQLWIGPHAFTAEVARSAQQVQTGMMHRREMAEDEGMLFVFPVPHRASFYMRNTVLPLSCAYLDGEGVILEIHDMKPLDETPIQASADNVQFVLETRQGWFQRHQIEVGTVIRAERGSLRDVFFRRSR